MTQAARVDREWFLERMGRSGLSLRAVAKDMSLDPSALSRTLNGSRKMQLDEVRKLATILGAAESEVIQHANLDEQPEVADRDLPKRHPLFGCMKGVLVIAPGVDLTDPADPDLADYLDREYGPEVRDNE